MKDIRYRVAIYISGNFNSSFSFKNDKDADAWMKTELPKLKTEYGNLKIHRYKLDGLRVGDKCHVCGEGSDMFTIVDKKMYSANRPGFVLDSGWSEEVVKCYKVNNKGE